MGKKSREKQEKNNYQGETVSYVDPLEKKTKLEKIYFSIIQWGTYLILFTPLIINKEFFFPYVVPKTIFFRILVDVILIAYLLLITTNQKYRPKMNWLSWSVLGFLVVTIISAILGENFIRSFWSTFERMTGVLTFIHLFAFFMVLTSVFREKKYWERILTVSILVGVILAFYVFNATDPSSRGGGTLGNTSFMSAYIIFNIFFALVLLFTKKGWWKVFYGILLIPILWLLLSPPAEPTQGAIGAFIGGIFLLGFTYFLCYSFISGNKILKKISITLVAILLLGGIAFSQTNLFKTKVTEISQSSSWQSRQVIWSMSFDMWKEKPWLGWGDDNFNVAFVKYYDPSLPLTNDIWYDRAHNVILDTMVASGIIGLLSYLMIFIVAVIGLLKLCFRVVNKKNIILPLGMIGLLATYLAQDLWVFDMISSYMILFISFSFIYFLMDSNREEEIEEVKNNKSYSFISAFLIIITLITIYFGNIKPAQSSTYLVKALSLPLEESIITFIKAINNSPIGLIEGAEQFSRKMSNLSFSEDVDRELLGEGFNLAEAEMKKAIEKSPNDFRLYLVLGKQYNNLYNFTKNEEALVLAEETLNKGKELSPRNQQVYWELSQNELYKGNKEGAIGYMRQSIDLEPMFDVPYWYLGMIYRVVGENQLAWEAMQAARDRGSSWINNPSDLIKAISVNQELGNNQELISLYTTAMALEPNNAQLRGGIAVAYANLGQYDKAREMAQAAIDLKSEFKDELLKFINDLPQ
ncbi:MAG: O-antigen ligase family protein [Candidatus Nealsonbacteria bacterium]